jgi:Amt family ammonium transporter
MNKRIAFGIVAVFVAWQVMDFVLHGLILGSTYQATAPLWRPMAEMKMGLMRVVGLVAITPAAGFISPMNALLLGAIAAFPSFFIIQIRSRSRLDDSLDVFAAHGTGGMVGALLTGVFAQTVWGGQPGVIDGNPNALLIQAIGILAAAVYSGVATLAILKVISLITPLRRPGREEGRGMDVVLHGEEGYARGEGAMLVLPDGSARKTGPVSTPSSQPIKEKV